MDAVYYSREWLKENNLPMFQSIIELNKNIPLEKAFEIRNTICKAFDNRAGKVINISNEPYTLTFNGEEKDINCLDLAMIKCRRKKDVLEYINSWAFIDNFDPSENCDILELFKEPIY